MQPVSNSSVDFLSATPGNSASSGTAAAKPTFSIPAASFAGLVHEILQRPNSGSEKSRDGQPSGKNGKDTKNSAPQATAAAATANPGASPMPTLPVGVPAQILQVTFPAAEFCAAASVPRLVNATSVSTGGLPAAIQPSIENVTPGLNISDKTKTPASSASGVSASRQQPSSISAGFGVFSFALSAIAPSSFFVSPATTGNATAIPANDSAAASATAPRPPFVPVGTLTTPEPDALTSQDAVSSSSLSLPAFSDTNLLQLTAAIPTGSTLLPTDSATSLLPLTRNSDSIFPSAPIATPSPEFLPPATSTDSRGSVAKISVDSADYRATMSGFSLTLANPRLKAASGSLGATARSAAPTLRGESIPSSQPEIKLSVPDAVERNTVEQTSWSHADSQTDTQTKTTAAARLLDTAQGVDAYVGSARSLAPLFAPSTSDTSKTSTTSGHSGPIDGLQIAAATANGDSNASQGSTTRDDAKNSQDSTVISLAPATRSVGGNNFAPTLEDAAKSATVTEANSALTPASPPITTHVPATLSAAPVANNNSTHETSTSDPQGPSVSPSPERSTSGQFITDASLAQNAGRSDIHIAIQTDSLGGIELHARVSGDSVGAAITVEKRDAHTALAVDLPALQQSLSDKQLRVEQITLVHAPLHSTVGQSSSQQFGEQPNNGHRAPSNVFHGAKNAGSSNLHAVGGFGMETLEIFDSQGRLSVLA
jgi:hypothetical protein